jgi:catechol 2,3-dioxygenase-like lactoylglutathione lyase family enzyme
VRVEGVLETCLYASDLEAAEAFYAGTLGLDVYSRDLGRHVFFRCGAGMFLVFNADRTSEPAREGHGPAVPPHGSHGPGHVAFRVPAITLEAWRTRFVERGIAVEADVEWPGGARSLYVRDPAGNSVELATAALWDL